MRGRRHGTLPTVTITSRYSVVCNQCGPVGEAYRREKAVRIRAEHLQKHGVAPVESQLSDTEVARLRRAVGLSA
jgi:hypothetical protein